MWEIFTLPHIINLNKIIMNLIKFDPFHSNFPSIDNIFDDFFGQSRGLSHFTASANVPSVNIKEKDNEFEVSLAIPGLSKDDCDIEVENGVLTISSEKENENKNEEKGKYSKYEYNYSSFSRSFTLPENIDEEKIEAETKNGELKIILPKKEVEIVEDKVKKIEIK